MRAVGLILLKLKFLTKVMTKTPQWKKSHVLENSWMVSDQMRLLKKRSMIFNVMTLRKRRSLPTAHDHFYQTSPQIVSGHSIGKSPMYPNINSCAQSIKERQLPECSTRDFNTKSCSAKNWIYQESLKDNRSPPQYKPTQGVGIHVLNRITNLN